MRARIGALLAGAAIVVSCGSPTATPSISGTTPTTTSSPTVGASAATSSNATASPDPSVADPWQDAGTMTLGRRTTHAILLGDGRVLVVGNDDVGCVRDDSVRTDIWDPTTSSWSAGPSLNKPRGDFGVVAIAAGRALVTGGVNAGTSTANGYQDGQAAYSSTYVYDPTAAANGWTKVALLVNARVAPAAVALGDGRVLAVGGFYATGDVGRAPDGPGVVLARYVPEGDGSDPGRLDDMDPMATVPSLATAELYDPATDVWSATGQMRYARIDPEAVTLADGRVLVVASRSIVAFNGVSGRATVDEEALDSAEIYDPATGRFTLTGDLPAPDWSALGAVASSEVDPWQPLTGSGTLVALAGGGALLVGRTHEAYTSTGGYVGRIVQTLLLDPKAAKWAEIDRWMVARETVHFDSGPWETLIEGHLAEGALVVTLADGTVLVAGGIDAPTGAVSAAAWRLDLTAGTLTALPEMPAPRAWGTAVALADGSALLLGGRGDTDEPSHCGVGETGLATTLRYVP